MTTATVGAKLREIKQQSGLTLDAIASAGGWKGRSSIQRLFESDYDPVGLSPGVAKKLVKAFAGKGDPPIKPENIIQLVMANNEQPAVLLPSKTCLQTLVDGVLRQAAGVELSDSQIQAVACHLKLCLDIVARNPGIRDNQAALNAVVEAAVFKSAPGNGAGSSA